MTIPSQSSIFSFAPQAQKYGTEDALNNFDVAAHNWYRIRAPRVSVQPQQMQDVLAPETGGPIVPNGSYKSMAFYGGDVDVMPRLERAMGFLFEAGLGARQTWQNQDYNPSGAPQAGSTNTYLHKYSFDPNNSFEQPWLAVRCFVPGRTAKDNYGDIGVDTKVAGMQITVPGAGLLMLNTQFQGRCPKFPTTEEVNAWTYTNANEESLSIPHAGRGRFLIGGVRYPITSAQFNITNGLTTPQQEMVIGDYYPDDFVSLSRAATIRVIYKWRNPDLWRQLFTGSIDGTDWDSIPFIEDTAGSTKAFEALFEAPGRIPNALPEKQFSLRLVANRVAWEVEQGSMELQAGDIIQVGLIGTVLEPAPGQDYIEVWLQNGTDYAWHKAPTLTIGDATLNFTEGDGATVLDNTMTFTSSLANLNGGKVTVSYVANMQANDVLAVDGVNVVNTAGVISIGSTNIGTVDVTNDGTAGKPLEINLDTADATPANVQTLLQNITYNTGATPSTATRVIELRVDDGATGFIEDEVRVYVAQL